MVNQFRRCRLLPHEAPSVCTGPTNTRQLAAYRKQGPRAQWSSFSTGFVLS